MQSTVMTEPPRTRVSGLRAPYASCPPSISRPPSPAMQFSLALTGKGFVLIAADQTVIRSIVKMKNNEDMVKPLAQIFS